MSILIYNPLISVITPNYNNSKYISKTIESVLSQTYQNWEMIIIDDCSNDGSYEIALEYSKKDSRICVYCMNNNKGSAACRNKAIELSKGEYLAFLDSDDLWLPEKLEKQLLFMEKNNCDFSFTEYEHINEYGKTIGKKAKIIKELTYQKLLFHCFTGCLTVMYKQDLNNKIYSPDILNCNDYALFLKVLKNIKNGMGFAECLAKYRICSNSLSRKKLSKIISYLYIMINIEKINIFFSTFYLITNQIIKIFWKYKYLTS